jgi:hypothetical protein
MNSSQLKLILEQGEGQFIEFKENLDKSFGSKILLLQMLLEEK